MGEKRASARAIQKHERLTAFATGAGRTPDVAAAAPVALHVSTLAPG
jgi:hypothetical protein